MSLTHNHVTRSIGLTGRNIGQNFPQARLILWRQFTEPYRKTVLGAVWALILPIVPIAAYVLLRLAIQTGAPDQNGIEPVIYVSVGVTLYLLFKDLFMAPVSSVQRQGALISQTHFPVAGAIMVGTGRALLDTLMRVLFCIPFIVLFAQTNLDAVLPALTLLLCGGILLLCAGVLIIPLWIFLPDIIQVLDVIFRFLIFFSLAIFPLALSAPWSLVITANPFAFFIEEVRALAFGTVAKVDLTDIGIFAILCIVAILFAAYVIGALENRIREMIA